MLLGLVSIQLSSVNAKLYLISFIHVSIFLCTFACIVAEIVAKHGELEDGQLIAKLYFMNRLKT